MGYAQKPLSFSTVIYEDSVDAQTLYKLIKNWMAQTFNGSNSFLEQSGQEITGKEKLTFPTNMQYSSINPNRSLEKASCHFLMTAIRKTALYMLDS